MKKVIAFALVTALALSFVFYAHTSVSASQDDLLVFPSYEFGDKTPLSGLTLDMTFACGNYLRWNTSYAFSGETGTEFSFNPEGIAVDNGHRAHFDVYLSAGFGSSTSGGSFSIGSTPYSALLRAASAGVGDNETETTNLKMADYVEYYLPDYDLQYSDGTSSCDQQQSLHGLMTGDNWYEEAGSYDAFFQRFRFPVQPEHVVSITIGKDDMRRIVDINYESLNGPELRLVSAVNSSGIWFVPVFQDESGAPLPYEAPEGHGIYFMPWASAGETQAGEQTYTVLTPDLEKLELLLPLEDNLSIADLKIDAEEGVLWMLTLEDGYYRMTRIDLATGEGSTVTVLPQEPDRTGLVASFVRENGYLLITTGENLALVSEDTNALLLTAPDVQTEDYRAAYYTPANGDLRYDGEHLILAENCSYWDGAFRVVVFAEGAVTYYGEYDCTLLRCNDDWYYSSVGTNSHPVTLRETP